ncbi:dematin isoform X2 [Ascaphus truei]|uniref:dematin isoform X2 n=1 Tax=Ascaphus truei TaxID=8439 RepID=UPI003F5AAD38
MAAATLPLHMRNALHCSCVRPKMAAPHTPGPPQSSNRPTASLPAPETPLTSPGSVTSSRGPSVPGSPSAITARMDSRVLGYKDLAALPQDKAILDIERPDLMIYEPHFTYTLLEHTGTLPSRERSLSPKSISPPPSPEVSGVWAENKSTVSGPNLQGPRSGSPLPRGGVQHFHCPELSKKEPNLYKKPPIYRQRESVVSHRLSDDPIVESSKFPAARPRNPDQPAKIETDYWPCPPSLAVVESERRQRRETRREEEEGEEAEDVRELEGLQRLELSKIQSNMGKLILKEEMQKGAHVRRKTRSLPDRTPIYTLHSGYGRSSLTRLLSAEFPVPDRQREGAGFQVRREPWVRGQLSLGHAEPLEMCHCVPQNGEGQRSRMDRGNSLPSMLEQVFPYEMLIVTNRGRQKLPPGVHKTQLERYLSPDEFLRLFSMPLDDFVKLPLWRRNELKRKLLLF